MKLTIIQTGDVPAPLQAGFEPYFDMFEEMFDRVDAGYELELVNVADGDPLPAPESLSAIVITGSAAGVYDDFDWIEPLRQFIRKAYDSRLPMVGICFGHQIMADALGGHVEKSEKGWGMGRHIYDVAPDSEAANWFGPKAAIGASHQDQVLEPPSVARTYLSSDFTPYAGLVYDNGAAISMQPHPEFAPEYSKALCDLRIEKKQMPLDQAIAAKDSLDGELDNDKAASFLVSFINAAASAR